MDYRIIRYACVGLPRKGRPPEIGLLAAIGPQPGTIYRSNRMGPSPMAVLQTPSLFSRLQLDLHFAAVVSADRPQRPRAVGERVY